MATDICIQKVVNVRFSRNNNWHRRVSAPRMDDALVLMTEGEIEYHFEKTTVTTKAGDLLLLPGNLPYSGTKHTDRVAFFVIDFQCVTPTDAEAFGAPCILMQNTPTELLAQFASISALWERQPIECDLRLKAFLYTLLCHAFEEKVKTKSVTDADRIVDYIIEHLGDESLTVSHLCRVFYISESQLRRNLVKATGLRPNDYILTLRLGRAKNELLDTDKSAKEIAAACGFSNPYYFSRCFSECYGMSPREFRKQFR